MWGWVRALLDDHDHVWDQDAATFAYVQLPDGAVDSSKKILRGPCSKCGIVANRLFLRVGPDRWLAVNPMWYGPI